MQRLTFDTSQDNSSPIWSPDGTRVAFSSHRGNKWGLYIKPVDGSATAELITESEVQKAPMSWSSDGNLLVYFQATGGGDVWAVPVAGDKKPFALLQSPNAEVFPEVSPDGKWIAYMSLETGGPQIYVKPFPDGPGKWQVSTDGGVFPRWRRDGKELFFYNGNNMIAADIRVTGSSLEAGVPRSLFGLADPSANHFAYHRYAVSPDGQRFLVSQPGAAGRGGGGGLADQMIAAADSGAIATSDGVTVVLNWTQMLKEK
jgi:Tol biopolymer transport system component